MRLTIGIFAAAAALSSATACGHYTGGEASGDVVPSNAIGLHVQNTNIKSLDVYTVSGGFATYIGTVDGVSSKNFRIDPSLALNDLRIVAVPLSGLGGQAASNTLVVRGGQMIDFRISPNLSNSMATIR